MFAGSKHPHLNPTSDDTAAVMEGISEESPVELYELPDEGDASSMGKTSPIPSTHGGHMEHAEVVRGSTGSTSSTQAAPSVPEKNGNNRFSVVEAGPITKHVPNGHSAVAAPAASGISHGSAGPQGTRDANQSASQFRGWTSETDTNASAKNPETSVSKAEGSDATSTFDKPPLPPIPVPKQSKQDFDSRLSQDTVRSQPKSTTSQAARIFARRSFSKLRGRDSTTSLNEATTKNSMDGMPGFLFGSTPRVHGDANKQRMKNAGSQWASERNGGGDGNTLAQLYAVFGLPKDPSVWTLAEEDCIAGVQHMSGAASRFWRPEVLGCSICPSPSEIASSSSKTANGTDDGEASTDQGDSKDGEAKKSSPKFIEMSDGRGGVEKVETARVLSKALKLSFTREVEVVVEQGQHPPASTSHTFCFSVPIANASADGSTLAARPGTKSGVSTATSRVGERSSVNALGGRNGDAQGSAAFYGVVLTVWSAADEKRAKMIRKELARAAKQRVQGKMSSTSTGINTGAQEMTSADYAAKSASSVFFMPYAICIVSRYPLYNLLSDWNKMAWHKYSRNIEMHNQLMATILRHPAPRFGEEVSVGSPEKDLSLHAIFPGAIEWGTGMIGIDFAMWPLFYAISVDNFLTACEIALGRNGRVLYVSRHPALIGLAVESTRYIVEQRGWQGVVHQNCHARDARLYLEDPGSWIIGLGSELRSSVSIGDDVCLVDLDINHIDCAMPPLGAVSKGKLREKRLRRLSPLVPLRQNEHAPPRSFIDAYPGTRFQPLTRIITRDTDSAYQQRLPPEWWDQTGVVQTLDMVLQMKPQNNLLKRVFKKSSGSAQVSVAEKSSINALRQRANTFVDARDGLENKIGRLNKRLAFLVSEGEMWRSQFSKIQVLVDRLTKEANDLRAKVDKERRESRRLSTTLAQRDLDHVQLQLQLKETESARELALNELKQMQAAMETVDREREAMMHEIRTVLSGGGDIDDVNLSISRLDLPGYRATPGSASPSGSQASSMTPSQAAEYVLKSRAFAEARINAGQAGPRLSTTGSEGGHTAGRLRRSVSHDGGELARKTSMSDSNHSHAHAFADESMRFEIQQRTSMVTDQISKIQQQLESTLTQLEGRRSGTFERETGGRLRSRRGSSASLASRYEYRSNNGHRSSVTPSVQGVRSDSVLTGTYASEDGHRSDAVDEEIESVNDDDTWLSTAGRRRDSRSAGPPPLASKALLRDALAVSDMPVNGPTMLGKGVVPPVLSAKSALRSQGYGTLRSPPSSELVMGDISDAASDNMRYEPMDNAIGHDSGVFAETMIGEADQSFMPSSEQISNGVAHQPLLTAVTNSGGHESSGQHSLETMETTGPRSPADIPKTLPADSFEGPGSEVLAAPGGWTIEAVQNKAGQEIQT